MARAGSRELSAVKIPASYNTWRPPKRRKNESEKIRFLFLLEMSFRQFGKVLEELQSNGRQNQLQRQILLQIDLF